MTSKRTKNAAADELDELFEGIGDDAAGAAAPKKTAGKAGGGKAGGGKAAKGAGGGGEKDILAELESELGEKQPVSRPHTPRIKEASAAKGSPARKVAAAAAAAGTPPPDVTALPRRSAESAKAASARTSADERPPPAEDAAATSSAGGGGGGWWGGLLSTATTALKQAEAAVKEIQQNEEAKKWADQVRGNYSALRGYGDELRHRALPTFTNILHTLAPPISSHERLLIHITHDMVGYPSLDPLVHGVFSRVMAQVEGGDLLVIQRGQESTAAAGGGGGGGGSSTFAAGWRDGPWWRVVDSPRDLGAVPGMHEGTKLCRASAEAYAAEYYAAHYGDRGLEAARQLAHEPVSADSPVRRSDLFLAVQAVAVAAAPLSSSSSSPSLAAGDQEEEAARRAAASTALFAGSAADAKEKADAGAVDEADESDDLVCFAVYVLDPVHDIVYHTVSQALPAKWVRWLDAPPVAALTPASSSGGGGAEDGDGDGDGRDDGDDRAAPVDAYERIPEDIREIVESGGVDPREWVAEWVEEALTLAVGVVAQRYVARRMGVGAGSIGKGKRRMDLVLEDGGGEAARAGLI